jgi:hypothetical protein
VSFKQRQPVWDFDENKEGDLMIALVLFDWI